jgi:hypothetical protein
LRRFNRQASQTGALTPHGLAGRQFARTLSALAARSLSVTDIETPTLCGFVSRNATTQRPDLGGLVGEIGLVGVGAPLGVGSGCACAGSAVAVMAAASCFRERLSSPLLPPQRGLFPFSVVMMRIAPGRSAGAGCTGKNDRRSPIIHTSKLMSHTKLRASALYADCVNLSLQ